MWQRTGQWLLEEEACGEDEEGRITKENQKTFGGYGYVHYLKCADVFISIYIYQNLSNCYSKYVQFIECQISQ